MQLDDHDYLVSPIPVLLIKAKVILRECLRLNKLIKQQASKSEDNLKLGI